MMTVKWYVTLGRLGYRRKSAGAGTFTSFFGTGFVRLSIAFVLLSPPLVVLQAQAKRRRLADVIKELADEFKTKLANSDIMWRGKIVPDL
jgi:hypothetical protein